MNSCNFIWSFIIIIFLFLVMEMVMTKQQSGLVKERNPTPQRLQLQAGRYLSDFAPTISIVNM